MRRVIVESPYAGTPDQIELNIHYAREALVDCLRQGEAPWASHLLYTQPGVLRDDIPAEREIGIEAGLAWGAKADVTAVYIDRGISGGMEQGIRRAVREGRPVEVRFIGPVTLVHLRASAVVAAVIADEEKAVRDGA